MYEKTLIRTVRRLKFNYHSLSGVSRYKMTLPMVKTEVLDCFELPIFNFSIDFELFWCDANTNGHDMGTAVRLQYAEKSCRSYKNLANLLKELNLPSTWAVVAKLIEPELRPRDEFKFSPSWSKNDWYSHPDSSSEFFESRDFIRSLKEDSLTEVISHGFGHIEFADESVTYDIAREDISLAKKILSNYVTTERAFIFSSNKIKHQDALSDSGYSIIRGDTPQWKVDLTKKLLSTPIGYWISPAMISLSQAKKLIDVGIKNKAFIHPWTHPRDINYKASDLNKFYRPLFEHVKRHEKNGNLQILSFDQMSKVAEAKLFS
jgi:hypothetical protein